MDEETFNIYYAGELLDGHDAASVRESLAVLFNASDATLDKLFSGAMHLIRRGIDREQALRYKAAMERAGARPRISRSSKRLAEPGLSLAAPGSDVLRPEERRQVTPAAVDTASLSIAPVGEDIPGLSRDAVPPPPDVAAFSLAAADAPPPERPAAEPVAAPDLNLAEAGADLLEARYRRRDDEPPPSTDHLELEP